MKLGIILVLMATASQAASQLEPAGVAVTPHVGTPNVRFRRAPIAPLNARVQLFVWNKADTFQTGQPFHLGRVLFDGEETGECLKDNIWSWHDSPSVWAHLRIKKETFDISGGWVNSSAPKGQTLTYVPFLKTLRRMHINTGHIGGIGGYTDKTDPDGLYTRYPLKYFNRLRPIEKYDTDAMRISRSWLRSWLRAISESNEAFRR